MIYMPAKSILLSIFMGLRASVLFCLPFLLNLPKIKPATLFTRADADLKMEVDLGVRLVASLVGLLVVSCITVKLLGGGLSICRLIFYRKCKG